MKQIIFKKIIIIILYFLIKNIFNILQYDSINKLEISALKIAQINIEKSK